MIGLLVGGPLCAAMGLAQGWLSLLTPPGRWPVSASGSAITLAYTLGAAVVPGASRGAAFGWLAMGVQVGTATSPLVSGALAAVNLPVAYLVNGALAWAGAGLLAVAGRGLRSRRDQT